MPKLFVFIAALVFAAPSNAQQTQSQGTTHRTQNTTKTPSGWDYAKSTGGNFSVLMPVPFKEFSSTNPVQYAIGGNSKEGIKCAVVKTVNDKKNIADFEKMVNGMKTPSNTISNIKKEKYQYYNAMYVEVLDKTECSYMKFIEAANDRFLIMIIFSPQNKKMADQFADRFFSSLKILSK